MTASLYKIVALREKGNKKGNEDKCNMGIIMWVFKVGKLISDVHVPLRIKPCHSGDSFKALRQFKTRLRLFKIFPASFRIPHDSSRLVENSLDFTKLH